LADASSKQLGRAQPASLQPVAFLLCRRAARHGWHTADPYPPSWSWRSGSARCWTFALGPVTPCLYSEGRFLNAAQAIAALHRRVLVGRPNPTDLEARTASIASCPPEYRGWLEDKLWYAHEPSLRQRLREVLDFVGPGVTALTGRRSSFVNRVVNMRNALTHWDERSRRPAGADLYRLAVALNFIIDAALLRLLGPEQDQVGAMLAANGHFQFEVAQRNLRAPA
jgi:ApeA N-terminal domain 1